MKPKSIFIKDLKKKYDDKVVLEINELNITDGAKIGVIGENGSGKSTLINCILGLIEYEGKIDFNVAFDSIGVLLQSNEYNDFMKVSEIISLVAKSEDIQEQIEKFELNELLDKKINNLSGGQKQRLTLFLTFINDPKLLILDEPTTGLDYKSRSNLVELIKMNTSSDILILISHYFEEIEQLTDSLLILSKGKTLFYGSHNDLMDKYKNYKFYIGDKKETKYDEYDKMNYNGRYHLIVTIDELNEDMINPTLKEYYQILVMESEKNDQSN